MDIEPGTIFDTLYEQACIELDAPDLQGCFPALDSDGVECEYHTGMVTKVRGWTALPQRFHDTYKGTK